MDSEKTRTEAGKSVRRLLQGALAWQWRWKKKMDKFWKQNQQDLLIDWMKGKEK